MHFSDHMSVFYTSFSSIFPRKHVSGIHPVLCFLFLSAVLRLLFVTPVLANETAGMDTVLVLDVSGSMVHTDPDGLCRQAAKDYLAALDAVPGTRAALVAFSDTIPLTMELRPLSYFGSEDAGDDASDGFETGCGISDDPADGISSLSSALDSLEYTSGDTDIGQALSEAVRLLSADDDESRTRSIVLFTDGEIDLPNAEDEQAAEESSLKQALLAAETAKDCGIRIHTVTLESGGNADLNLMGYLAERTGGQSRSVPDASSLSSVFSETAQTVISEARDARQGEESADQALTETETEAETQPDTEAEEVLPVPEMTEEETEASSPVQVSGSIDDPVRLSGILPSFCCGTVSLERLFSSAAPLSYTAYAEDGSLLSCSVRDSVLELSGLRNGSTTVWIFAQPVTDSYADASAQVSFPVTVDAFFPSLFVPAAGAVIALLAILLLIILRRGAPASGKVLEGTLQWYVKGEGQKIFGMPTQTVADLADYGNRVRLSELIDDSRLDTVPLSRVVVTGLRDGIRIRSNSNDCELSRGNSGPLRQMDLNRTTRFCVRCRTDEGLVSIIVLYSPEGSAPEYAEAVPADERTRLLV